MSIALHIDSMALQQKEHLLEHSMTIKMSSLLYDWGHVYTTFCVKMQNISCILGLSTLEWSLWCLKKYGNKLQSVTI